MLDGFKEKYPNVNVTYRSTGDNTPTVLSTAVQGGNPPDLAAVSQPGLVNDFQKKGALKPIDFARDTVLANYPADIEKLGEINGNLYGLIIKAANKSTVWYNVKSFKDAGVKPADDWDDVPRQRRDDPGVGRACVLDRRRRRLDAHRPLREHLPPPGRRRRSTTS